MKAIFFTDLYPVEDSRSASGTTFAVRELVEGVSSCGVDVAAVVRFFPILTRKGFQFSSKKTLINGIWVIDTPKFGVGLVMNTLLTRLFLRRFLRVEGGEVAVCHMSSCFFAAYKVFGRQFSRWVFVLHNSDLKSRYLDWTVQHADTVLTRSSALSRQFELLAPSARVDGVAYSGVPNELFRERPPAFRPGGVLKIVMASVFIPLKNIPQVLEAIALVSKEQAVEVNIYGDGPLRDALEKMVSALDMQGYVTFHGFCPRAHVLDAMHAADLFIMPSAPETLGMAYLEAMSQGCVVIGHAGWGVDGIIEDGKNGYLVHSATVAEIKHKILEYCASDIERIHAASYRAALSYTSESSIKNYYNLIAGVPC
ncbi:glycosyltransferase family 4 protein [Pseudomonas turukhanskensis]|uniref:Glycosyl transferase family 1 domain-containing protein n=1 Tax=Pseudomonas turukhanskensis TaxID=1806536 RepID=A0A9W6NFF1_9PSED|nr:glycosyltransferase family 4 protein [Pseudomonas turukhanskensis]GLK88933.1 hypothetical protein GCM10017655_19950 [Pseudomonas turukhanskensis]